MREKRRKGRGRFREGGAGNVEEGHRDERERPEKRRKGRGRFREGQAGNVEEGSRDGRGQRRGGKEEVGSEKEELVMLG